MFAMTPRLFLLSCAGLLLAGCSTLSDEGRTGHHPDREGEMSEDYLPVDNPILLSSLLDRDREETDEATLKAQEDRIQELEAALARLEADGASERTPDRAALAVDGQRTRIAVITDTPLQERLNRVFTGVSRDYPVRLLGDSASRAALNDAGCDIGNAADCANQLRQYPGVRMLVSITGEGENRVTVRYHDLELGGEPRTRNLSLPEADGRVPERALESLADEVLTLSLEYARTAPWFARAFSRESEGWAINAGEASGLSAGDQLRVHRPGRVIRGPGGQAAGWVQGEAVGTVSVTTLAGDDVAIVTLEDGQAPGDQDILIPMK
ncbi:MAG: hypothetical protein WED00_14085 [Aquisalimonadaceae bacterium]